MVSGEKTPPTAIKKAGANGAARSATTVSGQSTSGSVGSPSTTAVTPPSASSTVLRLNHLDIHADDAGSQGDARAQNTSSTTFSSQSTNGSGSPSTTTVMPPSASSTVLRPNHLDIYADDAGSQGSKKKKRGQRAAVTGDKSGRGLRQFSMKVCEKVESKGRTTYNEVADELVAEFAEPTPVPQAPDQQQYDEKNIRRRVYDALNVLMAMDIISKDKKEIQWKGLPQSSMSDMEELKSERVGLRSRLGKKSIYLQELQDQYVGLQNLMQRNEQLYSSGNSPSGGVALPFILVQTRPHATVEVEISEDMQLVHFDFNSTPFELHDDNYVLKAMNLSEMSKDDGTGTQLSIDNGEGSSSMYQPQIANIPTTPAMSPNVPGIIKPRPKNEC